jgi:tetratricopeptide (TPR) repeat protein
MERFDEALVCFQRAKELDPLSQVINDHLSYGYMLTGQMEEARKQIELTRSLDPGYYLSLLRLGEWHMREGDYERAARV